MILKVPLYCFTWYILFYWTYCVFNLTICNYYLYKEEQFPNSWDYNYNLTYLDSKYIAQNNLQNKDIDIEFSLGSISNFKKKVQRYFERNEHDLQYLNLPVLNLDASYHSSDSNGPYCDKISFTKSLISSHSNYSGALFQWLNSGDY